jgi:hypothetical protein
MIDPTSTGGSVDSSGALGAAITRLIGHESCTGVVGRTFAYPSR